MKINIKTTALIVLFVIMTLLSVSISSTAELPVELNTEDFSESMQEESTDDAFEFDESKFGDVNADGKTTAADARLILRCAAQLEKTTAYILAYGDYTKDDTITAADARTALRVSASLEKIVCILHGHEFEDFTINPTCTKEGYTTKKCSVCKSTDGSKTNVVPAKNHVPVTTQTEATCTTAGRFKSVCSVCSRTLEDYQTRAALGHNFGGWTETSEKRTKTCNRCNYTEIISIGNHSKTIYLTFDDGPGPYTEKLLGYLRKYNVKATFFVTNQNSYYSHLLKKIVDDGHAIGVHSLTHNWSIYSSVNSYMRDFNAMSDLIKSKTGVESKIFRFPGGTNNTVSRSYSKGIMKTLSKTMTEKGYLYFDWNVDCYDTSGYSRSQIINTTINQIKNRKNSIVLMHDLYNSTVEAVPSIIEYGLNNGYTFKVLDETAPSCRFSPVN